MGLPDLRPGHYSNQTNQEPDQSEIRLLTYIYTYIIRTLCKISSILRIVAQHSAIGVENF